MNYFTDPSEIQGRSWEKVVGYESGCNIVKEIGDGWWLFERSDNLGAYSGVLGYSYQKFFARHNPEKVVEHYASKMGYERDNFHYFTDGRSLKWVTRSFLPPLASDFPKKAIQQIGALDQKDIDDLERIRNKVVGLLGSNPEQKKEALKVAKKNREFLKRKWFGSATAKTHTPRQPKMPENVSATVNLLNGH